MGQFTGKKYLNHSVFNYGHSIDASNRYINFRDGDFLEELRAEMPIGSYTLGEFGYIVASALTEKGSQAYTSTLDRTTGLITILADNNFTLLVDTGVNKARSTYGLIGFTGADLSGANTYTGNEPSGDTYISQTIIRGFLDFPYNKEKLDAVVRSTPANIYESISYGTAERATFDIPLITDVTPQGQHVRETSTGINEVVRLLDYMIEKKPFEFVEVNSDRTTYTPCILDKVAGNSKGTGFKLNHLVNKKLKGYYELKGITLLKIEVKNG